MSDTPRTDASHEECYYGDDWHNSYQSMHEHAEQLERELSTAQARIAELEGALKAIQEKDQPDSESFNGLMICPEADGCHKGACWRHNHPHEKTHGCGPADNGCPACVPMKGGEK